jgi:hypothetical protein
VLSYWRKVMGVEDRVENLDEEGYCSHRKMLQCPVRDTIRPHCLAYSKGPDGFQNLVRVGQLWFTGRGLKVRLQCHVNHLNNSWDRRNGDQMKLSLQTVSKGFSFLESERAIPPRVTKGRDGVGNLITLLVILHIDWCL